MEEIGVFVRVYNVKPYLEQCISSVLSQTYSDFAFYVVDNGCTDGSSEILERYAAQDSRIRLERYEKNNPNTYVFYRFIQEKNHPYIAILDSDDWWEPDYLERLLTFMRENDLDLSLTGTVNYYEATKVSKINPKLEKPIIMSRRQFAERYPVYWVFPSTYWGNIMKSSLYQKIDIKAACLEVNGYGQDTSIMLHYLEHCDQIGIDHSALYHYRIRASGVSYAYTKSRFSANVGYTTLIRRFLEHNNAFSAPKQEWLRKVYLTSISATVEAIKNTMFPLENKVQECSKIICHPLTIDALAYPYKENARLRILVGDILRQISEDAQSVPFEEIEPILISLAPNCGPAISVEIFPLFLKENSLLNILLRDGRDELAKILLAFITECRYVKQYDLGVFLQSLSGKDSLLSWISDTGFIRKYQDIYWKIWIGQLEVALDTMTGLLLESEVKNERETFLQLYLSVAAAQNEIPAFLFGNIKLAEWYLQQERYKECRKVLSDLEDMGLKDHEELSAIRMELDTKADQC